MYLFLAYCLTLHADDFYFPQFAVEFLDFFNAKSDRAFADGEQSIILSHHYVFSGLKMAASLTHDNIAGFGLLAVI